MSQVTGDLFTLLGVHPGLGRLIGSRDDDLAATPAAVISDGYWHQRFGRSREALGATVSLDEVTYEIVGVLPPGFSGPDPRAADVWLPVQIAAAASGGDNWRRSGTGFSLTPLVRLAPDVTAEAASRAATHLLRATRADSNLSWKDTEATVVLGPILQARGPADLVGAMRLPLVVGGVALLVLLVATANVSNLLMLRVAARRRELAVRHALGAGRWGVGRLLVSRASFSRCCPARRGWAWPGWRAGCCASRCCPGTSGPATRGLQDTDRIPHYYLPLEQALADPETPEYLRRQRTLVVRTRGSPARTVPPVLVALGELFPHLPAGHVQSLAAVFAPRIRTWTVGTGLLAAAALLALALAALGLYAVVAYGVRQRELEFGIRRALGAQPSDLLRMILTRGLALTAVGIAAGAGVSLWAGRWVAPLLFDGRGPRDPLAFTTAAVVLVTAALAASLLPARRAAQADPRQALQAE